MKFGLTCIFTILFWFCCKCQSNELNHQKYWYYRARFDNDFIKVGLDSGESIPFNTRGRWAKSFNIENVELGVGDATSLLGNYIALLATEYFLLQINNQNTAKTKHELFCALNAINRLDVNAEGLWQAGAGQLNGFFIRDDIPPDFLKKPENYAHFNYYNAGIDNHRTSRGFMSRMNCGANLVSSDFIDNIKDPKHDISMSQDQVYNLLFGLVFVTKFVPLNETDNNRIFGYGSMETSLVKEAINIANRIINFTRNSFDLNGNSCNEDISTGWSIKNPTTCNKVKRGPDAHVYGYAISEIQCMINSPFLAMINKMNGSPYGCGANKGNQNLFSAYAGYFLWNNTAKGSIYLPGSPHYGLSTRQFNVVLSSLCNCVYGSPDENLINSIVRPANNVPLIRTVGAVVDWTWKLSGSAFTSLVPGFLYNITASSISKTAYINGSGSQTNPLGDPGSPFDHAPLVRKILHGGRYIPNNRYSFQYLLDVAPCSGIYNLNHLRYPHYEWSADNRLDHPNRRGWYGKNKVSRNPFKSNEWRPPSGEYNGIDYMLYHNLWYIHQYQEGHGPTIKNLCEISLENEPLTQSIKALENIELRNVSVKNHDSTFIRAGKTISFKPGTEITGVNNLRAYIQRFECAWDHGQFATAAPPIVWNFKESFTPATFAQPILNELDLMVAPTITEDKIKVFYEIEPEETGFITIMDLQGNIVYSIERLRNKNSGLEIDLSSHASGMYILRLFGTSGVQMHQKIIKR